MEGFYILVYPWMHTNDSDNSFCNSQKIYKTNNKNKILFVW